MIAPEDQFQIGEYVLYKQEGVVAKIDGYLWKRRLWGLPQICGYSLDCGVSVPRSALVRLKPVALSPQGGSARHVLDIL